MKAVFFLSCPGLPKHVISPCLLRSPSLNFQRHSSLSAIHRGLRRSEKARPQGFKPTSRGPPQDDRKPLRKYTAAERRSGKLAAPELTFRIRKGKKDITDDPKDEFGPVTRTSRFNSSEYRFGKKSLVYQFKKGDLQEQLKQLEEEKALKDFKEGRWPDEAEDVGERRPARRPAPSQATSQPDRDRRPRRVGRRWDGDEAGAPRERDKLRRDENPVSIPYTTAASQFLYGTSAVEAALRANRRKAYKLYVYGGSNRQNVSQDRVIERLASRLGVKIQRVDESGQRMMDKMSGGRPHNGYILEASPLPQLPVAGLGAVSDAGSDPGYSVMLGHQSQEEAQINGTNGFIPMPASRTHKPLVLLLDRVLDPGNVGAILRTASFLGVSAVAISKKGSASLTPVALKASSGASETVTLFSVESPAGFLVQSREAGWKVYAGVPGGSRSKRRQHMSTLELEESDPLAEEPCVLLVGSEGEGLSKVLRDKADCEVSIPGHAAANIVDSLNVSVATSLLCSAFLKGQERARLAKAKEEDSLFSMLD